MRTISESYTHSHVRSILNGLGISIASETFNDFLCYCPFHSNRSTPSFSVSTTKGLYLCFNPGCDVQGNVIDLVKELSHRNDYEAMRFIQSCKTSEADFEDELSALLEDKPDFMLFPQETLDLMHKDLDERSIGYFLSRGIDADCIDYFKLGYSKKQDMVIVPVHSPDGMPVGLVGRSIEGKDFKNSKKLPISKTMFNIHRAKKYPSVIIVESSFDAIRVHGAGYSNVVATLGGHISKSNFVLLGKYFNTIVVMTDNDKPKFNQNCRKCYPSACNGHNSGREIGMSIVNNLSNKDVLWAVYDNDTIYPHDAKDAGDMTNEEIRQCVRNAVSHVEYVSGLW
jgi:DNA primase